jgi:hypothetical protein
MRRHFRSALIILIAWIVARSLIVLPFTAPFVKMLDLGIYDTVLKIDRFLKTKINQPIYDSIVIVDIDDKSLSQLGQFSQWPNQYFADATNILNMDAPKLIAYDVMFADSSNFTRQSRDRITNSITDSRMRGYSEHFFEMINGDDEFAQAIFDAGNVFLAMFNNPNLDVLPPLPPSITPWDVSPRYALEASHPHPPIPVLADVAYGVGFAQFPWMKAARFMIFHSLSDLVKSILSISVSRPVWTCWRWIVSKWTDQSAGFTLNTSRLESCLFLRTENSISSIRIKVLPSGRSHLWT